LEIFESTLYIACWHLPKRVVQSGSCAKYRKSRSGPLVPTRSSSIERRWVCDIF
jgi:hypothetical protein